MRHRKQPNVALSQYASLILLRMFNPAMQCVRGLSDASALKKVQRLIGGGRVSLGSLSESVRVFDPQLLKPMIEGLLADLPQQQAGAGQRRNIPETVPEELAAKLHAMMVLHCERCRRLPTRSEQAITANGSCIYSFAC